MRAQDTLRQNLITATAASSVVACFVMGAFANMPVALAPGLGLNAYFALNVVRAPAVHPMFCHQRACPASRAVSLHFAGACVPMESVSMMSPAGLRLARCRAAMLLHLSSTEKLCL